MSLLAQDARLASTARRRRADRDRIVAELLDHHRRPLLAMCRRFPRLDPAEAWSIAMASVWDALESYRAKVPLAAWILFVCRRDLANAAEAAALTRRQGRSPGRSPGSEAGRCDPRLIELEENEAAEKLQRRIWGSIPFSALERRVLQLRAAEWTHAQIAAKLGRGVPAIKAAQRRARAKARAWAKRLGAAEKRPRDPRAGIAS